MFSWNVSCYLAKCLSPSLLMRSVPFAQSPFKRNNPLAVRPWFLLCLALMGILRVTSANASDERVFSLFPIIYTHTNPSSDTLVLDVCWPFATYQRDPERTYTGLHPLFSYEADRARQTEVVDLLWPFSYYQHVREPEKDQESWRAVVVPIFQWRGIRSPELSRSSLTLLPILFTGSQGPGHSHFIVFPFFWYAKDAKVIIPFGGEKNTSFFALFPLYGHFSNFLGRERIRFYLWPLLSTSRRKEFDSINICWPFLGMSRGPHAIGWRVWPLFTYGKRDEESLRISYLWPLGHYKRTLQADEKAEGYHFFLPFFGTFRQGDRALDFVFPFYLQAISPERRTYAYLWPLLTHTENLKPRYREISLFWFLFKYRWGEEVRSVRLFPLFHTMSAPDHKQTSLFWLLYNYKFSRTRNYTSERRYFFPFCIQKTITWNDGRSDSQLIVLPFFNYRATKEGEKRVSSLWPLWYIQSTGMERNWEPLWRVYELRSTADGIKEVRILGNLYHSMKSPHERRSELNLLLFHHRRRNEETYWSLLGGLVGRTKTQSGSKWRLFYHSFF
jgi:hypothetical protein